MNKIWIVAYKHPSSKDCGVCYSGQTRQSARESAKIFRIHGNKTRIYSISADEDNCYVSPESYK